ncbi:MAG: hypothetical protein FWH11_06975 [Micrococcales bacterium]|nr:hypothetical protein [Micrococcales bacterium]
MVIPDDLPRSPTGRVPQWVIDEASGRIPDAGPWRGDEPTVAPTRPRRQWLAWAVVVTFLGVAVALHWSGSPWATTSPTADVVALADEATMTDTGKKMFFGNDPRLLDADDFPGQCPPHAAGCYDPAVGSIVVYQPADERLHGWVVTAATHEMLHAAYDSLSPSDRDAVAALLAATVATLSPDDPTLAQIDASVGDREQIRTTEQFAYIGTQVTQVDPRLEDVYARFLDDRQVVVDAYTTTTTLLSDMAIQLIAQQQILVYMEAEGSAADIAAQRTVVDSLSADVTLLRDQLAVAG